MKTKSTSPFALFSLRTLTAAVFCLGGVAVALFGVGASSIVFAQAAPTACCRWLPGPDMPTAGIRLVGVFFPGNFKFYAMGGRASDSAGSDFTNPFIFNPGRNRWFVSGATYPDNQVNNMA